MMKTTNILLGLILAALVVLIALQLRSPQYEYKTAPLTVHTPPAGGALAMLPSEVADHGWEIIGSFEQDGRPQFILRRSKSDPRRSGNPFE